MLTDLSIGDEITVNDPGDQTSAWNNEFRGTVRGMKHGFGGTITVEDQSGQHIDVHPGDIAKKH